FAFFPLCFLLNFQPSAFFPAKKSSFGICFSAVFSLAEAQRRKVFSSTRLSSALFIPREPGFSSLISLFPDIFFWKQVP
ncbi:hypothetical protein, partial [Flavobacterium denitrificans]